MLHEVPLHEVRLGMFVHAVQGPWLQHPFWRTRFVLERPEDLARLLDSDVPGIVIDDERGVGVGAPGPASSDEALPPPSARRAPPSRAPALADDDAGTGEEQARARRVVAKAKRAVMKMFGDARLGLPVEMAGVAPLVEEISASLARDSAALVGVVQLKNKDEYTYVHSVAVCALMIKLARAMELDEAMVRDLGVAGLFHDIGKIAIPDPVLNKPGPLDQDEFAVIRTHPERGHELLLRSADVPVAARHAVLHHHERYDGSGYPHRLAGEQISLAARMAAICDVYDAITSNRPYKDGWTPGEAVARMMEWRGHFDPQLLDTFVGAIGIHPVGTLVRLRSNRLGLVVGDNPRDPSRPRVVAFYAIPERQLIAPQPVKLGASLSKDAILRRELPEHWVLGDWPALSRALLDGKPLPVSG